MTDQPFPRKKKLGYFSKTLFLVNVLAVIALLLSYSAAYIDPVSFWPLAFFGLGYLPILLINMGFVCYWLFRRKRYMLFGLIFILCGWNFLNSHINFKNKQEKIVAKTDSNIRVMSYNVHLFQMVNNPKDNFREETVELINSLAPDVVCFQEFYSRVRGTQQFSKALKKQAGFEDYYFRPSIANEYEGYGQAIFSKYPIIRSGSITEHGFGINKIIFVDIKRESDTLRVYNVHLRSFALQEEDKAYIQNVATEHMQSENRNKEVGAKLRTALPIEASKPKRYANILKAVLTHV